MHQGMMSTGMGMGAGSLGVSNMMLGLTAGMQHMGPLIGTQAHGHGHNPGILAGAQHMMMSQPHVAALQSMVHDPAMQAALLAAVGQPMAAAAMGMQPQVLHGDPHCASCPPFPTRIHAGLRSPCRWRLNDPGLCPLRE